MNSLPTISIVTPSLNQGRFIEETLKSIMVQNYPQLEHIVVDGGSTDNTLEILKRYESIYPMRWISEPDEGQSDAINKGIRMAKGEVVSWVNSDDVLFENGVTVIAHAFRDNPDAGLVYGSGAKINEDGSLKRLIPFRPVGSFRLEYVLRFLQPSAFFKRGVFLAVGGLDTDLEYAMDWDLFIKISRMARVVSIPEPVGKLREYLETKTASGGWIRDRELAVVGRRNNGFLDRNNLSYCIRAVAGRLFRSPHVRGFIEYNLMVRWWGGDGFAVQGWPDQIPGSPGGSAKPKN
jgi:glycosyltransferase involved in cell wall biosynthesis